MFRSFEHLIDTLKYSDYVSTINLLNLTSQQTSHIYQILKLILLFILETNWICPGKKVEYFNLKPGGTNG